eukprot:gnl/TRDRNA2_/TRDRNA2_164070_c2_seq2.p1 gnl/TRDRNA2_/TRDRNA2_164070_c2~~gnl/TRDRNA2_/TRDRNA2_164070_c2_seq2.p1  ORF type:complete len:227 (-),score=35.90 gnl/TRDRNA2_/TRDRNA2_164070_c2_seq2:72-752(-)
MGWQKMQAPRAWQPMQPARALQHTNMQTATLWPNIWPARALEPPSASVHILATTDDSQHEPVFTTAASSRWLAMEKNLESADTRGIGSGSRAAALMPWLDTLLSTRYSLENKDFVFLPFHALMKSDDPEKEVLLDELLLLTDSVKDNAWCQARLPIQLPSLRLKLGSLRRVLALMTGNSSDQVQLRQALLTVIGKLSRSTAGIRALEKRVMANPRALDVEHTESIE